MQIQPLTVALGFLLLLQAQATHAYGSAGSSGSCSPPSFYDESPQRNSVVPSLSEFAVTASDNTELSTLNLEIDGKATPPVIEPLRSGESRLRLGFSAPFANAGKLRITLAAKSKDGCAAFQAFYLEIKP
jgi:hypothetical protein